MTHIKKITLGFLSVMAIIALAHTNARAYTPTKNLDIRVSITASKSLTVNTTSYNFGAMPISSTVVSGSSISVTNDSGGLVETYTIQGASATPNGAGTNWVLAAAAAQDQYALQAQFNDMPAPLTGTFNANHNLTFAAVAASGTQFAGNQTGLSVQPAAIRGLWFQIKTPTAVTDTQIHIAQIVLAVQ